MSGHRRLDSLAALTDAELVDRARQGEQAAFESLFHRHQDRVYTIALGMLGNPEDSKDVVQETFLRAYRRLASLNGEQGVLAYLCKTASNASIDLLRKRKGARSVSIDDFDESLLAAWPGQRPDQAGDQLAMRRVLETALASLSEEHRIVVVMHHIAGLPVDEIAAELRLPVGTVKSRLGRGREALRRKLPMFGDKEDA